MQLEVQPDLAASRRIGMLVCDFDDTITQKDTIGTLLGVAAESAAKAAPPAAAQEARQLVQAAASQLSAGYVAQLQELLDESLNPQAPGGPPPEFDLEVLAGFLGRLSDFDCRMNQAVVDSGVLAGMRMEDVRRAGGGVPLRPHAQQTLARAAAAGIPVHVVSVNWSASFLTAALGLEARPGAASAAVSAAAPAVGSQALVVHANELELGGEDGATTTGAIRRCMENARDKGRLFEQLLLTAAAEGGPAQPVAEAEAAEGQPAPGGGSEANGAGSGSQLGASVYIGDSASDLLAMLSADYGIVIGSNQTLRRVAAAFGVCLAPLSAAPSPTGRAAGPPAGGPCSAEAPVLYEAQGGWDEVATWLFGAPGGQPGGAAAGSNSAGAGSQAELKVP